jgi:hypothetical protein
MGKGSGRRIENTPLVTKNLESMTCSGCRRFRDNCQCVKATEPIARYFVGPPSRPTITIFDCGCQKMERTGLVQHCIAHQPR